jgi:hypothetical protein
MRVFFGLVKTWLSHAGDGDAESMLVVAHLGATTNHQGAAIDRPGAARDRQGATIDRLGAIGDRQGAATNCKAPSPAVKVLSSNNRVLPMTIRVLLVMSGVDHGVYRSRHMDLHNCTMVGANCCGLW